MIAAVLATAMVTVVLALPPLRRVGEQISRMSLAWIGVAVMLEIASCAATLAAASGASGYFCACCLSLDARQS